MAQFNEIIFGLLEEDIIGLTPNQATAVEFQLCVSIAERGPQVYENMTIPRFKNFFGYAQIMSGPFVVQTVAINYINQEILHWRDISFYINETTGCYAKGLAELIDKGPLVTNTVKTRQRYTSIRFRFHPGVLANACITWEEGKAQCMGNILEPDDAQGRPPHPKNHQHNPDARPEAQGGDGFDPTVNDGMPYNGEPDRPPYAELQPANGEWKMHLIFDQGGAVTYGTGDHDPSSVWSVGGVCYGGQDGATSPNNQYDGKTFYKNGQRVGCAEDGSKGRLLSLTFTFEES